MLNTLYYLIVCVAIMAVIGWSSWKDDLAEFEDHAKGRKFSLKGKQGKKDVFDA